MHIIFNFFGFVIPTYETNLKNAMNPKTAPRTPMQETATPTSIIRFLVPRTPNLSL